MGCLCFKPHQEKEFITHEPEKSDSNRKKADRKGTGTNVQEYLDYEDLSDNNQRNNYAFDNSFEEKPGMQDMPAMNKKKNVEKLY